MNQHISDMLIILRWNSNMLIRYLFMTHKTQPWHLVNGANSPKKTCTSHRACRSWSLRVSSWISVLILVGSLEVVLFTLNSPSAPCKKGWLIDPTGALIKKITLNRGKQPGAPPCRHKKGTPCVSRTLSRCPLAPPLSRHCFQRPSAPTCRVEPFWCYLELWNKQIWRYNDYLVAHYPRRVKVG